MSLETVVYTAHTHVTGGRIGHGASSDGAIDVQLSSPGSGRPCTNPEQLFGIGYSACFIGALEFAAKGRNVKLPTDTSVDAEVDLGKTAEGSSMIRQSGLVISPRPIASICCSPPDSVLARWARRSRSRGIIS